MSHEYLIDQLQFTGAESITLDQVSQKVRLNYNHPVKELVWIIQREANFTAGTGYNDWFNFSASLPGTTLPSTAVDLMADGLIMLNGHERFSVRPQTYFRLVQPYQHHTRIPEKHIYVYSFGIRPEEHQPSGTVNMSRIDNAQLKFDLTNAANLPEPSTQWVNAAGRIEIFAPNYNVFRVNIALKSILLMIIGNIIREKQLVTDFVKKHTFFSKMTDASLMIPLLGH
jgi:hypothetical protein